MLMSFIVSSDDSHCKIFEGLFCKAEEEGDSKAFPSLFSPKSNAIQTKAFSKLCYRPRGLFLHFIEFHGISSLAN